VFNVLGDLSNANLRALNFTQGNFGLSGLFDLNFSGHNIDQFLGTAKVLNATLIHDTTQINFDSLVVNAAYSDSIHKMLSIESNEFSVKVLGEFSILDLPNSFQTFLHHYYPSYIEPPKTSPDNQRFSVIIKTQKKFYQVCTAHRF